MCPLKLIFSSMCKPRFVALFLPYKAISCIFNVFAISLFAKHVLLFCETYLFLSNQPQNLPISLSKSSLLCIVEEKIDVPSAKNLISLEWHSLRISFMCSRKRNVPKMDSVRYLIWHLKQQTSIHQFGEFFTIRWIKFQEKINTNSQSILFAFS